MKENRCAFLMNALLEAWSVRPHLKLDVRLVGSAPRAPMFFHRRPNGQFHASTCEKITRQEERAAETKTHETYGRNETQRKNTKTYERKNQIKYVRLTCYFGFP